MLCGVGATLRKAMPGGRPHVHGAEGGCSGLGTRSAWSGPGGQEVQVWNACRGQGERGACMGASRLGAPGL